MKNGKSKEGEGLEYEIGNGGWWKADIKKQEVQEKKMDRAGKEGEREMKGEKWKRRSEDMKKYGI